MLKPALKQEQDMIKRLFLAATVLSVAALSATTASAQSSKAVSIGISGGAAIPVGDLGDVYSTGYNGTLSLMFRSFGSPIGLRVDGMYNKMSPKDDAPVNFDVVDGVVITSANANLVYNLPGTGMTPYLIGGAGIYNLKLDLEGSNDPDSQNKFGVNGGIGASFPLSGFNAFIEARYHHVFSDNNATQFIPVVFGISL
jgi:opacity protein-like surface antigen